MRINFLAIVTIVLALRLESVSASTRGFDLSDRLASVKSSTTDGQEQLLSFERPSIVVLWATWSPVSLKALKELIEGAPKGGVRWQVFPINVDSPELNAADTARVNAAARAAGLSGPVFYDRGYRLMDSWGVFSIPTVVLTALGGTIDEIEHDWTPAMHDRIFTLYFGVITDSFPGMPAQALTPACLQKVVLAREMWRSDRTQSAIQEMHRAIDSCSGLSNDAGRLSNWMWSTPDSLRLNMAIARVAESGYQNAWTLSARAGLAQRRGDCTTAVALCTQAVAMDSAFQPGWMILAECSWQLDDSTNAKRAFERARALNRNDERVLALGSLLAEARGDKKESIRLMRAAVDARLRRSKRSGSAPVGNS